MLIRKERERDQVAVRAINEAAFETPAEANLVDSLRDQANPVISLVAEMDGDIVGHIMFSPVSISGHSELRVMGLAPMAVLPERQRDGVGSALVREGLAECARQAYAAVVVLGHPEYYPRFGFVPASRFAVGCEYNVPDEVFMAMEIQPGGLDGVSGTARYHEAFAAV